MSNIVLLVEQSSKCALTGNAIQMKRDIKLLPAARMWEGRKEHRGCSVLFIQYMNESVKDVGIEGAEILGQPDLGTDSMLPLINLLT